MLTRLKEIDLSLVFQWRNDASIRNSMFSQNKITWDEHLAWFNKLQLDKSKKWLIYKNQANQESGVVYFKEIDDFQKTAFWGFYTSPDGMPGSGTRMAVEALNMAFNELGLKKLSADVLDTNIKSITFHKKIGFIEEGCFRQQFYDGKQRINVVRFGMLASEWLKNCEFIEKKIHQFDQIS